MSVVEGKQTFVVPGDTVIPFTPVGKSLVFKYGIYGRMPQRTVEDVLRSCKKHVAEVLDERGGGFLAGLDDDRQPVVSNSWEVRLWDEPGAFRFPFARISLVGPDTSVGPAFYADVTQAMTVHLYPHPAPDTERAILGAIRLRTLMTDALKFGAARGKPMVIPLWDYGGSPGLDQGSEARFPFDYFRVTDLASEHLLDPEDDTQAVVIVNFRAQWRRVPSSVPGHLIESVRMTAHPS